MNVREYLWRAMVVVGLVAMLLGVFDPLEGSLVILLGSLLIAAGALVGKTPQGKLLCWAFVAVAVGVGALFALSAVGGVGGRSGHSWWWLLTTLPYPVGWLVGLGGLLAMVGRGSHRILFAVAMLCSVCGLSALIVICLLRMPGGASSLIVGFVIVPHGIALITALTGGVIWMVKSRRISGRGRQ